ncbi:MAG: hypothetical protein EPN22_03135 [Nitrospirae bacterium]|nr:MAG: hypothetical protein EPN22_03135 [Nitrospirota bacterium]
MDKLFELTNKYFAESYEFSVTDEETEITQRGVGMPVSGAVLFVEAQAGHKAFLVKNRPLFLKYSYIYKSLLADIVSTLGAKKEWTMSSGNAITVFFTADGASNNVWNAILSAMYVRTGLEKILPEISPAFDGLGISLKTAVHFDSFIVADIGRRIDSAAQPVDAPFHIMAGMESRQSDKEILISGPAAERLDFSAIFGAASLTGNLKYRKLLLRPVAELKTKDDKIPIYSFEEKKFEKILSLAAG